MAPTSDSPVSLRRSKRRGVSVSFAEEVETLEIPMELCYGAVLSRAEPSNFELATANMKAPAEGEMPTALAVRRPEEGAAPSLLLQTLLRLGVLLLGPCFGGDDKHVAGSSVAHGFVEVSRPGESPC